VNQQLSADQLLEQASQPHLSAITKLGNYLNLAQGKWALAAILGLFLGYIVGYSATETPIAEQAALPTMAQCVTETLRLFDPKKPITAEVLRDAREHCYSLIQGQGLLNDYAIRKLDFFQQYRANGVLMWMVVIVTFSGVALAALQLWLSYQLAVANNSALEANNGELILQRGKLVLKSSITGLFILLISFCFFLVFVIYVYRLSGVESHFSASPVQMPVLPAGGLGPPTKQVKP
jgi:hypothetical protein